MPSGHGAPELRGALSRITADTTSKGSLRIQESSSFSLFFNTQMLAGLSLEAVTIW